MAPSSRHEFQEHRGELEIRVEGPTLPALFAEAGRALAEVMGGAPLEPPQGISQDVVVEAPDREALLVAWLDELVFHAEVARARFTAFDVRELGDRRLVATLHGTRLASLRNPVKAATYHRLSVAARPGGGFGATVILDV